MLSCGDNIPTTHHSNNLMHIVSNNQPLAKEVILCPAWFNCRVMSKKKQQYIWSGWLMLRNNSEAYLIVWDPTELIVVFFAHLNFWIIGLSVFSYLSCLFPMRLIDVYWLPPGVSCNHLCGWREQVNEFVNSAKIDATTNCRYPISNFLWPFVILFKRDWKYGADMKWLNQSVHTQSWCAL